MTSVRSMARLLGAVGARTLAGKSLDFEVSLGRLVQRLASDANRAVGNSAEAIFARTMAMDDRMHVEVQRLARGLRVRCALQEGYVRFLGEGIMKSVPAAGK